MPFPQEMHWHKQLVCHDPRADAWVGWILGWFPVYASQSETVLALVSETLLTYCEDALTSEQ